ncbi:MAG: FHA domain-containing protein [Ilumatobacter sp.]|uniref:FHA domain-containing protein n=1 Tax=Ilumatobacter sp. TaxID=1967498 RepID=UPI00329A208B
MPANTTTDASSPDDAHPDAGVGDDGAADDAESPLAWGTTAFDPGGDVGLVARHTIGLIERDNPSTRERLWGLVSQDAPLDDILDELSSTGLKALPDFGLAQVEGSAIRVVARGRTIISAELSSGSTHEIDPSGVRTWIEELVDDVSAITISLAASEGDPAAEAGSFAVLAGSVPASSLTRRYDAPDDHAEFAESGAGWVAGGTDAAMSEPGPAPVEDVEEELSPAPVVELEMLSDIDEPAGAAATDSMTDDAADHGSSGAAGAGGSGAGDEVEAPSGDSWFEDQAGAASSVVPPQPAMPDEPIDQRGPVAPVDITADPVPGDPQPADPQPASPQPPPPGGPSGPPIGPGAGGPPPDATVIVGPGDGPSRGPASSIFDDDFDEHAAGSVTGASPGDHDGMTVGRSELDDLQAEAGHTAVPAGAATVHGVLVFSNGERVDVDRPILIGRNPKVAGAVEGGLPHIMKFDGPGQGLSRTHAEVRVEGGEVLVEDLQSTNGTEVQLPGQQRRRLRGGEPVVIVPGTLIDFGDELNCTLESAS